MNKDVKFKTDFVIGVLIHINRVRLEDLKWLH